MPRRRNDCGWAYAGNGSGLGYNFPQLGTNMTSNARQLNATSDMEVHSIQILPDAKLSHATLFNAAIPHQQMQLPRRKPGDAAALKETKRSAHPLATGSSKCQHNHFPTKQS